MSFARSRVTSPILAVALALAAGCGTDGPSALVPTGGGSALLPRPILLVLHEDASVRILDPANRRSLRTLSFTGPAGGIAASLNGTVGFVSGRRESGGGALYSIDLRRGLEGGFIPSIMGLAGIAADPDGDVWVAVNFSANVLEFDPDGSVDDVTRIETPARNVAIAFLEGPGRVITAGGAGATVIDPFEKRVVAEIPTDQLASDLAVTTDEAFVYITHGVNTLYEISTATNAVTRVLRFADVPPVVPYSSSVAVLPNGTEILVTSTASPELIAVDRSTFEVSRRRTLNGQPSDIVVTRSNDFAYVSLADRNEVTIIELNTFERSGGLSTGSRPAELVWVTSGGGGIPDPPTRIGR